MKFLELENTVFFRAKSWWKYNIHWLLKSSYFELFRDERYRIFLNQKVDGKMMFTDYWKVLVLNFSEMGNTVFFERKNLWKDDIHWLLKNSCFDLFGDKKYGLFFTQKVDEKIMFTWSFWAFHDIPGLEKYGFSCSVSDFLQSAVSYWN